METRECKTCKRVLPIVEFHGHFKAQQQKTYYKHECKQCTGEGKRTAYHSDPLGRAMQVMYSMETHVKHKYPQSWKGSVAAPAAEKLLSATSCNYCGCSVNDGWSFSLDHHVPLALGGEHSLLNLHPCCEPCNRAKHDMPPSDYMRWLAGVRRR